MPAVRCRRRQANRPAQRFGAASYVGAPRPGSAEPPQADLAAGFRKGLRFPFGAPPAIAFAARLLTSAIHAVILVVGWVWGFRMLVVATLAAQVSAAVADTSRSGGLFAELTRGRVTPKQANALLAGLGLALTWTANVFEIVAYASRAFLTC